MESLVIPARFCGPPGAANGGYLGGRLAALLGGSAEVTYRRATPLERALSIERVVGGIDLNSGDELVAEARTAAWSLVPPAAVSPDDAARAAAAFPRFVDHPVPRCFVCGVEREPRDGLRIFPGPVPGRPEIYAARWVADPSLGDEEGFVRDEILWAALDCPGAFAVNEPPRALALLGRFAASVVARVRVGEPVVVMAWPIDRAGRKLVAGTAIYSSAGELRAVARATWILTSRA